MRIRRRKLFPSTYFLAFLAWTSIGSHLAFGDNRHEKSLRNMVEKARSLKQVRVIIKMRGDWVLDSKSKNPKAQRLRIKEKANRLVAKVGLKDPRFFEYTPHVAATVDLNTARKLAASPLVESVFVQRLGRFLQYNALPEVGVTYDKVWTKYAGEGKYIAIVDTGIQREHPFIGADRIVAENCFSSDHAGEYGSRSLCTNELPPVPWTPS